MEKIKNYHFVIAIIILLFVNNNHAQEHKKPIEGLVTMGKIGKVMRGFKVNSLNEALTHPEIYSGVVVLASWNMLEEERGKYDFSVLDEALNQIKAYNTKYPKTPLAAKFRIFVGPNAPKWVLKLAGGPMTIHHKNKIEEVAVFWSSEYRKAWRALQEKLAERYDNNELLREVAISSCATLTAEPFIQPLGNIKNIQEYQKFGFSDKVFQDALEGAFEDYSSWKRTCLDYTMNPFPYTDSGKRIMDATYSITLMKKFRAHFGKRAIVANHGLQNNLKTKVIPMYAVMKELGYPISFQTYSPNTMTTEAVELGINTGSKQIEIWDSKVAGGFSDFSIADLKEWQKLLSE